MKSCYILHHQHDVTRCISWPMEKKDDIYNKANKISGARLNTNLIYGKPE